MIRPSLNRLRKVTQLVQNTPDKDYEMTILLSAPILWTECE